MLMTRKAHRRALPCDRLKSRKARLKRLSDLDVPGTSCHGSLERKIGAFRFFMVLTLNISVSASRLDRRLIVEREVRLIEECVSF